MATRRRTRFELSRLEDRFAPAIFPVTNALDSGAGSLRSAIQAANAQSGTSNDIVFDVAIFSTQQVIPLLTALPDITRNVNITGTSAANCVITRSASAFRIFNCNIANQGSVNMSNLTITNGSSTVGGGINMNDDNLKLTKCVVANNSSSGAGGGIALAGGSMATLSTINCTISGNSAATRGGGVYFNTTGTLYMEGCTVSGNSAGGNSEISGGGLYFWANSATIINSTISTNHASKGLGGGIGIRNKATVAIENSTIALNDASVAGGGVANITGSSSGSVFMESTIVAKNKAATADDVSGAVSYAKFNLIGEIDGSTGLTDFTNLTGTKASPLDPLLGPLANNGGSTLTHLPAANSPATDRGDNIQNLPTDQRGNPFDRLRGNTFDIGAVESATSLLVTSGADSGPGTLRQAVLTANANSAADTIEFDPFVYSGPPTITLTTGQIPVTQSLTILGSGTGWVTIDGNSNSRLFYADLPASGNFELQNVSLVHGYTDYSDESGSAIYFRGQSLRLIDCSLLSNTATYSGGAISAVGTLIADRCLFDSNMSTYSIGGAIELTTITGNSILDQCSFTSNTAFMGGAVSLSVASPGTAKITNSTFASNSASGSASKGGAAYVTSSVSTILFSNCTIADNTATYGGGIFRETFPGGLDIESSVVSGNHAGTAPDIWTSSSITINRCAIGSGDGVIANGGNNLPYGANLKLGALSYYGGPTLCLMPALDSPLLDQGSNNEGLTQDQRGRGRLVGIGYDIGAVEVQTTHVDSIARNSAKVTSAGTVSWTVHLADGVAGVDTPNFALSGPGATGSSITNVSGSDSTWTVTAKTGGEGALELDMINYDGMDMLPTNVPFAGESYVVDKLPLLVSISASQTMINDYKVGPAVQTLTATYSEPMNTAIAPVFDLPVENPGVSLVFSSGQWLSPTVYQAKYSAYDQNVSIPNIDVRISGGQDSGGVAAPTKVATDVFSIDTANPLVVAMNRNDPSLNNLPTVSWNVIFSEPVSGLSTNNFGLFNGGLNGVPTVTSVTGSGTTWTVQASNYAGEGNLGLYMINSTGVTDNAGNPVAALPIVGPNYAIDPIPPRVLEVKVNDGTAHRSRVTSVTVKFLELVSFVGDPAGAFTLTGTNGPVTLSVDLSGSTPIQTVAKLTFSGANTEFTSLKDGRYTLTIAAAQVTDMAGNPLDGDGNGAGGDNYTLVGDPATNKLFRLYGDADGNGIVDGVDFGAFRSAFNTNSFAFDFDGSGVVDGLDFGQFRQRFGMVV